jgi:hypothetical protein
MEKNMVKEKKYYKLILKNKKILKIFIWDKNIFMKNVISKWNGIQWRIYK